MGDKILNVVGAIVTVALVTTVVSRSESARIVESLGNAFSGSLRAAMGR